MKATDPLTYHQAMTASKLKTVAPTPALPACPPPEPYIRKQVLGKRLSLRPRTLDDWMKRGLLPFYKVGRSVRFKWSEVEAQLAKTRRGAGGLSASQNPEQPSL